ncbi:pirin family protein [Actinomycetes bacterium M1A6_2h]
MTVELIRAADRKHWWDGALDSWQSFPATGNFDLEANAHGVLLVHNEDTVAPGEGFDRHHHENMEIVTWVLEGAVEHKDSEGNSGIIRPGTVQRMSAGTGVVHSERNVAGYRSGERLRVVQMWIAPSRDGTEPSYEERDVSEALAGGELITIASGIDGRRGAVGIGNRNAALDVARLAAGQSITVPRSPFGHVFVADGEADFDGVGAIARGDAVRLTDSGGQTITASTKCEILIWEMLARLT